MFVDTAVAVAVAACGCGCCSYLVFMPLLGVSAVAVAVAVAVVAAVAVAVAVAASRLLSLQRHVKIYGIVRLSCQCSKAHLSPTTVRASLRPGRDDVVGVERTSA